MKEERKQKVPGGPWYLRNAGLFLAILLAGCFVIGGSVAYTLCSLFFHNRENVMELSLSACCLFTVAVGGVGGYLWLIKKSEEIA